MALKKGLKAKWLRALRSGKYKQGHGQLKMTLEDGTTTYCCLGVLRELDPTIGQMAGSSGAYLTPHTCGLNGQTQRVLARINDQGTGINPHLPRRTFKHIANTIARMKDI